ncbi:MAG: phosphoribosylformylglycinamidine synthase I [Bdellovibrio sp.]|nr:MAG: phosphoribosylformylglycinamidine synthase I [Bdellovibrio sp.]
MIGIVRFPGTNCDRDVAQWVHEQGDSYKFLWHLDRVADLSSFDALILPGGFSYGDYLRSGALAARSPVMASVREYAERGGAVLGICNGFQVLVESHLLPGALVRNENLRFIDDWVELETVSERGPWGENLAASPPTLRLPIAHGEGRFYASDSELNRLEERQQVWLRYVDNPNGSRNNIAGVLNEKGNVAGLMPHPERAIFSWMGSQDGRRFFARGGTKSHAGRG